MNESSIRNFELVYYGGVWMGTEAPPPLLAAVLIGLVNDKSTIDIVELIGGAG